MVKFSIIIPVYNTSMYLPQCLDSVLSQTFKDFEIVLVDDGSTDNSLSICEDYSQRDKRIKLIKQKNSGVSVARNTGIANSDGEYITFLDSDDFWDRNNVLEEIARKADVDTYLMTELIRIRPNGSRTSTQYNFGQNETGFISKNSIFSSGNLFGCFFLIIKKNIILNNSLLFDESAKIGEDVDFSYRTILASNKIELIDTPYYVYRINRDGSAMTTKGVNSIISYFEMVKKWEDITNTSDYIKQIYSNFCNNAFGFISQISLKNNKNRNLLISSMKEMGIYDNANGPFAVKSKKIIKLVGINNYLNLLKIKMQLIFTLKKIKRKIEKH